MYNIFFIEYLHKDITSDDRNSYHSSLLRMLFLIEITTLLDNQYNRQRPTKPKYWQRIYLFITIDQNYLSANGNKKRTNSSYANTSLQVNRS